MSERKLAKNLEEALKSLPQLFELEAVTRPEHPENHDTLKAALTCYRGHLANSLEYRPAQIIFDDHRRVDVELSLAERSSRETHCIALHAWMEVIIPDNAIGTLYRLLNLANGAGYFTYGRLYHDVFRGFPTYASELEWDQQDLSHPRVAAFLFDAVAAFDYIGREVCDLIHGSLDEEALAHKPVKLRHRSGAEQGISLPPL